MQKGTNLTNNAHLHTHILLKLLIAYFQEGFQEEILKKTGSDIKHEATAECFISDKARIASVLNSLKNEPPYEFIGEVILKINVAYAEKIKAMRFMFPVYADCIML
jgi:hypothetical protein